MEYAENFDALQAWPDAIRDDIAGIRYHQLPGAVNPAGMAKGRIILQ